MRGRLALKWAVMRSHPGSEVGGYAYVGWDHAWTTWLHHHEGGRLCVDNAVHDSKVGNYAPSRRARRSISRNVLRHSFYGGLTPGPRAAMNEPPRGQLELLGLDECLHRAEAAGATPAERRRLQGRYIAAHSIMSAVPDADELAFLHSGLCQTYLPHARLPSNQAVWTRSSGRFSLIVQPGLIDDRPHLVRGRQPTPEEQEAMFVGVPYGARARLILIYLQTEGVRGAEVQLGESLSAWIRALGLTVTGGRNGSITGIREQALRIARCRFTLDWTGPRGTRGVRDIQIVRGLDVAATDGSNAVWPRVVYLDPEFQAHLAEHAVPLDRRAIAHLAGNSLSLDLYALFAYRLPRLSAPGLHLSWQMLQEQLGSQGSAKEIARRIRDALPDVLAVYPEARVAVTRHGLMLRASAPSVPRETRVQGFRMLQGGR